MSSIAQSNLGQINIGMETTYGTAAALTDAILAESDSFSNSLPEDVSKAIFGSSEVQESITGLETAGGGLTVQAYGGVGYGRLLKSATRSLTSTAIPSITAQPTHVESGSGTAPAGIYFYFVAAVLAHTASGLKYFTNLSPATTGVTLSGINLTTLTYVLPSLTALPGWTIDGVVIWRTAAGGAANTAVPYDYQSGAVVTYADTGAGLMGTGAQPSAMYLHQMDPATASPKSFTLEKVMNNGKSEVYVGCMVAQAAWQCKASSPFMSTFTCNAQRMLTPQVPTSTAVAVVPRFHGRRTFAYLQNQSAGLTAATLFNGFDVTIANKLNRRDALGLDWARVFRAGNRDIKGTIDFQFEDVTQLTNFKASPKQVMSTFVTNIGPSPAAALSFGVAATSIAPFPYCLNFDLPNIQYDSHTAALSGDNPVDQKLPFIARQDVTKGYACEVQFVCSASTL